MNIFEKLAKSFFTSSKEVKSTEDDLTSYYDVTTRDLSVGGYFGHSGRVSMISQTNAKKNQSNMDTTNILAQMIPRWQKVAQLPEVRDVIEDTVNTMLDGGSADYYSVPLEFKDKCELGKEQKQMVLDSYHKILELLNFDDDAYSICQAYIIDGRLQGEAIYEENAIKKGVIKIIRTKPIGLRRVWDDSGVMHYTYLPYDMRGLESPEGYYKTEQFVSVESPIRDIDTNIPISYLNAAIKPSNNLTNIEDSMILVRFMKGVKLRIWNVNVGKLSQAKSKLFLQEVEKTVNQDLQYDSTTGEFKSTKKMSSIFQDYIFPNRNTNDITQVDTVDGDTALLEDSDHQMFLKKLYKALHQPVSRLSDTPTIEYDSMDLLKDEQTFQKFVNRLRAKIREFIFEFMKRDLIAKGKFDNDTWDEVSKTFFIKWGDSSNIIKRVEMELWSKRAETLADLEDSKIAGNLLSYQYISKMYWG